jgi:hypothetical protein
MPNSTVVVEQVSAQSVRLALAIPLSELAAALGRPADSQADISAELSRYLNQHVSVVSADGLPWLAKLEDMASADGEHLVMVIVLSFTPPPGASSSPARLRYDAINHQVASHYALVYHRVGGKLVPLGRRSGWVPGLSGRPALAPAQRSPRPDDGPQLPREPGARRG